MPVSLPVGMSVSLHRGPCLPVAVTVYMTLAAALAPPAFARAVDACLEPDQTQRPSIAELAQRLRALVEPG